MSLQQQLMNDMKQAMKDGDKIKLGAIRFLRATIKNYEIDHGEQDDEGVQQLIATQVKQMKEAIEEYQKGGREDLVNQEQAKLTVLEEYLPQQMSDQELKQLVATVIEENGSSQPGPIIGQVMAQVSGKADGSRVAQMVQQLLSEQ